MLAKLSQAAGMMLSYAYVAKATWADDLGEMTMNAQIELSTVRHPFLCSLPPEHLAIVLHNAKEKDFAAGEIILKQGEPANRFFLIESGRVAIEAGIQQGKTVQMLGPGEPLGWSWLFPPFSWHFSARALEPTKCIVMDGAHLLVAAEENPKFGYELMRRISQILVSRLRITCEKLLEASALKQP